MKKALQFLGQEQANVGDFNIVAILEIHYDIYNFNTLQDSITIYWIIIKKILKRYDMELKNDFIVHLNLTFVGNRKSHYHVPFQSHRTREVLFQKEKRIFRDANELEIGVEAIGDIALELDSGFTLQLNNQYP
ncbi:hypothetical protein ACJX0J_020358, partial [Zea mays]